MPAEKSQLCSSEGHLKDVLRYRERLNCHSLVSQKKKKKRLVLMVKIINYKHSEKMSGGGEGGTLQG